MMNIKAKIDEEMVAAAKAQNKIRLSAIRMMKAALHNKEISLMKPLDETETLQVLSSMIKQRKDSIDQFSKGGRTDLVEKEETELKIIQEFLPAQMSEDEIEDIIRKTIQEAGAVSIKDMGKVMKLLMPKLTGMADGKIVGEKVKTILSK